jgi:hypothetical protein
MKLVEKMLSTSSLMDFVELVCSYSYKSKQYSVEVKIVGSYGASSLGTWQGSTLAEAMENAGLEECFWKSTNYFTEHLEAFPIGPLKIVLTVDEDGRYIMGVTGSMDEYIGGSGGDTLEEAVGVFDEIYRYED